VFLLPFGLGAVALILLPVIATLGLAFTDYDALSPPIWAGLTNFQALFNHQLFGIAVRNSLFFVLLAVPLRLIGALALALLFRQPRRGVNTARAVIYFPTMIPDVAYALLWLWIVNPVYGPLNLLLGMVGLPTPSWLADPLTAKVVFVFMSLFQIGEGFILLLVGLMTIPREYYDAAAVDGASRWKQFTMITLPLLAPWLMVLTVRDIMVSLQGTFTATIIMTRGEPYYATLFLPMAIYDQTFDRFRFGIGSAMMVVTYGGLGILLWGTAIMLRKWRSRHDRT
jgi:multiple sugar transport system permease protein